MVTFNISLAGYVIEVNSSYTYVREYCRKYLTQDPASLSVTITSEDIEEERALSYSRPNTPENGYSDEMLEVISLNRKAIERLIQKNVIMLHASAIAVDGKAYLFSAQHGAGKSTHTRLWREIFGSRAVMINDDKPLIAFTKQGVFAFGSPWSGKDSLDNNICAPVKGICFISQAQKNTIELCDRKTWWPFLLKQIYKPKGAELSGSTIALLEKLSASVPLYVLKCNMEREAAFVSYNFMHLNH